MSIDRRSGRLSVNFFGGARGGWRVERIVAHAGPTLPFAARLDVRLGDEASQPCVWSLRGVTDDYSYTTASESAALAARQPPLGRVAASRAALIPIRKSSAWWALSNLERREVYEERSHHTTIGLEYLPRVARRLHYCRDAGAPFDFLTWFEFAPEHDADFDELLTRMRASEEWRYVDREVEVRIDRVAQ